MKNFKYDPILIPLIRKVVPAMIAQDIVSVHPMSSPFSIKWDFKEQSGRWVAYYSPMGMELPEVIKWCSDVLGPRGKTGKWDLDEGYLSFEKRMYVDWFLLQWSR